MSGKHRPEKNPYFDAFHLVIGCGQVYKTMLNFLKTYDISAYIVGCAFPEYELRF